MQALIYNREREAERQRQSVSFYRQWLMLMLLLIWRMLAGLWGPMTFAGAIGSDSCILCQAGSYGTGSGQSHFRHQDLYLSLLGAFSCIGKREAAGPQSSFGH